MPTKKYDKRLAALDASIRRSSDITRENREIMEGFVRDLKAMKYSKVRICKLWSCLKKVADYIDFDFDKAANDDLKDAMAWGNPSSG